MSDGLCGCGCGLPAPIARKTDRRFGHVKEPGVLASSSWWDESCRRREIVKKLIEAGYSGRTGDQPNDQGLELATGRQLMPRCPSARSCVRRLLPPLRACDRFLDDALDLVLGHVAELRSNRPGQLLVNKKFIDLAALAQGNGTLISVPIRVRGRPVRFVCGHSNHGRRLSLEARARMSAICGQQRYNWKGDAVGRSAAHDWINRHYPRTGVCESCGVEGKTHYAFTKHPERHTRNRDDYRELCPKCHLIYDEETTQRAAKMRGHRVRRKRTTATQVA
jgi:hypothetical protein